MTTPQGLTPVPSLWRPLLDAIPGNLVLLDPVGTIVAVNRNWTTFAHDNNWPDQDAGLGQSYFAPDGVAGRLGETVARNVAAKLSDLLAGTCGGFSFEYTGPDGQRRFSCTGAPLLMDGGTGAVVMHIDITGREVDDDRLEKVNQARYDFICTLAHELRSPHQAIVGFSELLERQLADNGVSDRQLEYLRMIRQSGSHVLDIVNGVLDLAKAEAGRFELDEEVGTLADVGRFAVEALSGMAGEANVGIAFVVAPGMERLAVSADQRLLRQSLVNILSNAIKVTPGGRTTTVTVDGLVEGRPVISVTDEGPGIKPEDITRIMRPFVRIKTGRRNRGTGLGLTLSRTFMQLHGGDIDMSSALGVGTTVRLWLPAARLANTTKQE